MKNLFLSLLMACFVGNAFADDNVTGLVVGPASGTDWTMHVVLNNEVSYNAFQMDITLPEGFSVSSATPYSTRLVKGENVTIDGTSYETSFAVNYETVDKANNVVRVLAYNLGNNAITGKSGDTVVKLKLTSTSAKTPDDISAGISKAIFVKKADLTGVELATTAALGALRGDVDHNKVVNTTDAVSVVNYFLGKDTTIDTRIADMDDNDIVNTTDAVEIVNVFLGKDVTISAKPATFEEINVAE